MSAAFQKMGHEVLFDYGLQTCGRPFGSQQNVHESEALIAVINGILVGRTVFNENIPALKKCSSEFHGLEVPKVLLLDYLHRIEKYAFCSRSCFVVALVYLDWIAMVDCTYRLTAFNVHRLFLTALVLAVKFCEDVFYDNAHFAKVGGITVQELNRMELEFLKALEFRMHVSEDQFAACARSMIEEVSRSTHHSGVEAQLLLAQTGFYGISVAMGFPMHPHTALLDAPLVPDPRTDTYAHRQWYLPQPLLPYAVSTSRSLV
ncbi:Cyclin-U4-1 [Porphyridium purpureum]|uniref:Cyclin-U4-1 n=1 Tax=Porphyridium purpureum TaxID=35688 RepID=A0A5J4Z087_PORPP|nr:Cyclin-U4-1 [Porphyridium purpureum]|eukprot:POR8148..scf208_2